MAFNVVKGSDFKVTVSLINKNTKKPFPLAGFTGATGQFPDVNGAAINIPATLVSADLGQVQMQLPESADLKVGDISFQLTVDQGATRTIVVFEDAITIHPEIF